MVQVFPCQLIPLVHRLFMSIDITERSGLSLAAIFTVLLSLISPTQVLAADRAFTPYLGYRVGGEFEDFTTGNRLKLEESDSYGFAFGWGEQDRYEIFFSQQPSSLSATSEVSSSVLFDVDVINIMFAGKKHSTRKSAPISPAWWASPGSIRISPA